MTGIVKTYAHEHGGRVGILFLLFLLAIYNFITAGFGTFAVICAIPFVITLVFVSFKWPKLLFWTLIIFNYIIHLLNKNDWILPAGIPISIYNELLEIALISIALIDIRKDHHWGRAINIMSFAVLLWALVCLIELLNDTCGLGIDIGAWFSGFRLIAIQLFYFVIIFSIYIDTPQTLVKYLRIWACLSLFSVYWSFKQQYIGLTSAESAWLYSGGPSTHLVNGIIRYWSTFILSLFRKSN